ncbi:MAG: TRAP transporter large permease subunit, partial [Polaromonas sp.]|nr:TRAP transporter large permease subunit [Polaromonas sp.]
MDILLMGGMLLIIMLVLLAGGVWIAMTLAIVGWVGQAFFTNTLPGKNLFSAFWESNASWELAALPLFIWMGEILFRTKLSEEMFDGLRPWLNRIPGRLMHTTIIGCGVFGSVSGSSAATCATIAKVALPELKRRGYNEKLAIGSLASAGTLGILIPPSITMVVYAVAADASIIRIFLAGFLPGFLLMLLFSGYIGWWSLRNPDQVPPADPPTTFMEKIRLSGNLIPCGLLIVFIVWVLVAGWATATECAAFGVLGSLAIAAWGRCLTWKNFTEGLMGATRTSCMIMFILAGAAFLTKTMAFTGIPRELAEWVDAMHLSPYALIGALVVVYLILGTALDGISMIVLT